MKTSQLRLSIALLCFVCKWSVRGNPCEIDDYKDLNQGDRTEGYKDATDKCDSEDLKDEWHYWYVVSGNAGNALASKNAPKKGTCGTKDRLYLKDGHPDFHDGEVTKTVCIAQDNTACSSERHIQVINCGAFYLYKLVDLGYCTWRYCTNGEEDVTCKDVSCPTGQLCALRNNGKQYQCVSSSPDPCSSNPCQNGGTCNSGSGSFTCNCPSGYTGNVCANADSQPAPPMGDPCSSNPCQNGGTCYSNSGSFTCSCVSGYTGDDCSTSTTSLQHTSTFQDESPKTSVESSQQHSRMTTQVQQLQSVESSTQAQMTSQQTSKSQKAASSSVELLSAVSQQHSIMTTQAQQLQLVESSIQAQMTSQQTSKSQKGASSSVELLSAVSQEHSIMTTQAQQLQFVESSIQAQMASQQTLKSRNVVNSSVELLAISQQHSIMTTQVQQLQSVESSPQAQMTSQQTSKYQNVASSSVDYSSPASQQQSIMTTQAQQLQSVESSAQSQMTSQQTSKSQNVASPSVDYSSPASQQQSIMTTQAQQLQSVESSAQSQMTSQQTSKSQNVASSSVDYSSPASQQQSIMTTQAQQLQSVESSAQSQMTSQQTSQQSDEPSSVEHLSATSQQQSTQMTTQTNTESQLAAQSSAVEELSKYSWQRSIMTSQSFQTSHSQIRQTVEQSLHSQVQLQPSQQPSARTQSQQETLNLLKPQQTENPVSASPQSTELIFQTSTWKLHQQQSSLSFQTQQGVTQHTVQSVGASTKESTNTQQESFIRIQPTPSLEVSPQQTKGLSSPSTQITGEPPVSLQSSLSSQPAKQLTSTIPSQQQHHSSYPVSRTLQPSSVSLAQVNGSSIAPVHGNWSSWSPWPNCNKPCNGGIKTRKRLCDNPEPAFGGKTCTGPTTEKETCNLDSCPADEINYHVRFKGKNWSTDLANPGSQLYKEVEDEIQQMIVTFYKKNGEDVTVEVLSLRNGSIIASFNVSYQSIDSLQIVVLQEQIAGGMLGNSSAELLNITSNYVPNEAPVILQSNSTTSETIYLKWSGVTQLNSAPLLGYVIVYKEINEKFHVDAMKSVAPKPPEAVLIDLKKFTNYTMRVYAFTRNGNGVPSEAVSLRTQEDVPSESPPNTIVKVTSSSTIEVRWEPINKAYVHGILLGYEVRYAKGDDTPLTWKSKTLDVDTRSIVLRDLAKFSPYKVVICAKTSKGCGKEHSANVNTWDDVPSMPPQSVTAQNLTSELFIDVTWSPVPEGHINGILLGYFVKYQRILTADWEVFDTAEHVLTVKPADLAISLRVQTYSTYGIKVAAFTRKGLGPYSLVYGETCRCPKVFYTNYWSTSPYLKVNGKGKTLEGIFSGIVTDMIHTACGICPGHGGTGHTKIDIISNGKEKWSAKKSVLEVLNDIDEIPQISFPIYGNKYITRYMADYAYINLVESPGVAFIATRRPPGSAAMNMMNAVMDCVPMIVLSACMAYISGFIIWALDSKNNPDEFPPSFIKGVGEGFWWSFISMTTVGYGDRSPRSIPARIFGIIWTLTGLVIISILIGAIASSLTFVTVEQPIMLYGTKIGAIQDSVEHRLGILKNAKVNEEQSYSSVEEIRAALEDGEIDGALLDTYVAAEHKETLFHDKIFVKEILDRPFGYGVVLSGAAVNVEEKCRDYINLQISEIFHIIQNMTKTLDAPASDAEVDQSTGLFDSSSAMFRMSVISLLGILGVAVCIGLAYQCFIFLPRRNRVSEEELKTSTSKLAYKEALLTEMKEFVDSFYHEMSKKIFSIRKKQAREIRDGRTNVKHWTRASKFGNLFKKCPDDIATSNVTVSSWASEKQYELHKQLVQLVSESRSHEQVQEWELPNTPVSNHAARESSRLGNARLTQPFTNSVISPTDSKYNESLC